MMLNLMKYLKQELKKLTPRIYNKNASENAIFPYVVFKTPTSNQTEKDSEDIILEIDVWEYAKDGYDAIAQVEILTATIDKFLRNNRHLDENQLLIFQKINQLSISDPDGNIERRQLRYVVRIYDRNK